MTDDDPWDAFGDDSDSDNADDTRAITSPHLQPGISFLVEQFVKHNPQINLANRLVASLSDEWSQALIQRGLLVPEAGFCDAAIVVVEDNQDASSLRRRVVPGGYLLVVLQSSITGSMDSLDIHPSVWNTPILVDQQESTTLYAIQKWSCPINATSCAWKPRQQKGGQLSELNLLHTATIVPSATEMRQYPPPALTGHAIQQAVHALTHYGYCVIRQVLDGEKCRAWGDAILQDFHAATRILLEKHDIDLLHPHDSKENPQSYRELSMREDLRLDLRDGPQIRRMRDAERRASEGLLPEREQESHGPTLFHNGTGATSSCLRFHPTVLRIVQQAFNPKDDTLFAGNFGRYNFGGSGPDGSPLPMRIGPMGGIISLPHSADQAIHADTPHLFETHECLPPHYVNAFCLGADVPYNTDADQVSTGATQVGGTAFVHASHKLSFTAALPQDWSVATEPRILQNLVRPALQVGDLVLFDCRILHFGLANSSDHVERPLLYSNMTQAWFHDPKNWNDQDTIFAL